MKTLNHSKPHNLPKLADELLAIPGLKPVVKGGVKEAVFYISGDGQTLKLEYPDAVEEAEILAVINGHDPKPAPPPADSTLDQGVSGKIASGSALTAAETAAALRFLLKRAGVDLG